MPRDKCDEYDKLESSKKKKKKTFKNNFQKIKSMKKTDNSVKLDSA